MTIQATIQSPNARERCSQANFKRLTALIHSYSGIKMHPSKMAMLHGRLRRRIEIAKVESLDDYCNYLFDRGGLDHEIVALIDAVTTNKTDFFREPAHFDFLRDTALPALVAAGRSSIKIWSAACSIGAEPYTLAMVLEDFRRQQRGPEYSILATDICTEVLAKAHAGCFSSDMMGPIPVEMRKRYVLVARDQAREEFRIVPQLRSRLSISRLNLMDEHYSAGREMDFIFCRNILIYFDRETQMKVLSRLCEHLRPGGLLILGHSESAIGTHLPVTPIANTIFRRN